MKSIIQKSLYILFLANFLCHTSSFASKKEMRGKTTHSPSLKRGKKSNKKYFILLLFPLGMVACYIGYKNIYSANNSGDNQPLNDNENINNSLQPDNNDDPNIINEGDIDNNDQNQPVLNPDQSKELNDSAMNGDVENVKRLLKERRVNTGIEVGQTVLQQACYMDPKLAQTKTTAKIKEIVKMLLKNGADVNASNNRTPPPLFFACSYYQDEIVEIFLKNGADVRRRDQTSGNTALHAACEKKPKTPEKKKALSNIITSLLKKDELSTKNNINRIYSELLINLTNKDGKTALHIACKNLQIEAVQILLNNDYVDPNIPDNNSLNAAKYLCKQKIKPHDVEKAKHVLRLLKEKEPTNFNLGTFKNPELTPSFIAEKKNKGKLTAVFKESDKKRKKAIKEWQSSQTV